jgi:hypothetical protein
LSDTNKETLASGFVLLRKDSMNHRAIARADSGGDVNWARSEAIDLGLSQRRRLGGPFLPYA